MMWILWFVLIAGTALSVGALLGWLNDKVITWWMCRVPPMPEPYEPEEV